VPLTNYFFATTSPYATATATRAVYRCIRIIPNGDLSLPMGRMDSFFGSISGDGCVLVDEAYNSPFVTWRGVLKGAVRVT